MNCDGFNLHRSIPVGKREPRPDEGDPPRTVNPALGKELPQYEAIFIEDEAICVPVAAPAMSGCVPKKAHRDDAAFDIYAHESVTLRPDETQAIGAGHKIAIPEGYVGLECSRSGLAMKGIVVANAPGVIDPGYRGECKVLLHNNSDKTFYVDPGDRIAQLLIVKLPLVQLMHVNDLPESKDGRGEGGFGSTGR